MAYFADQRAYFDALVEDLASYQTKRYAAERRAEIRRVLDWGRGGKILNVGCGVGLHDLDMAAYDRVERVVGIDVSERSIEVANANHPHPKVERFVDSVFTHQGSYDVVVSFQVIEHLEDPVAFLRACAALTTGAVIAFTPNRKRFGNFLRRAVGRRAKLEDPSHFAEYTAKEMAAFGREAGLTMVMDWPYSYSFKRLRLHSEAGFLLGDLIRWGHNRFGVVYEQPH